MALCLSPRPGVSTGGDFHLGWPGPGATPPTHTTPGWGSERVLALHVHVHTMCTLHAFSPPRVLLPPSTYDATPRLFTPRVHGCGRWLQPPNSSWREELRCCQSCLVEPHGIDSTAMPSSFSSFCVWRMSSSSSRNSASSASSSGWRFHRHRSRTSVSSFSRVELII